jgi:exopolysaccharide production protein ExoY
MQLDRSFRIEEFRLVDAVSYSSVGGRSLPVGGLTKRLIDIAFASCGLILCVPLMLLVAPLVRILIGPNILFTQRRVGFGAKPFVCYKFRTMISDDDTAATVQGEGKSKLVRNPRITRLGRILRKTSLDELPQFWNILRGDMSLVGPRPVVFRELEEYGPYKGDYLLARPGLTGVWQTHGRSLVEFPKRAALDRYYVRRWSLLLDLVLVIKTLPALIRFDQTA